MSNPLRFKLSGLLRFTTDGFWTPSLTFTEPEIPYLPLETPAAAGTFNASWNIAANTLIHPGAVTA